MVSSIVSSRFGEGFRRPSDREDIVYLDRGQLGLARSGRRLTLPRSRPSAPPCPPPLRGVQPRLCLRPLCLPPARRTPPRGRTPVPVSLHVGGDPRRKLGGEVRRFFAGQPLP